MSAPPGLQKAINDAWMAAVTDDSDDLTEHLAYIAGWGARGIHVAVAGWSAISLKCLTGGEPGDGFYALEVTDTSTGKTVSVDRLQDPANQQAVQAVTVVGNKDFDTLAAIARAAFGADYGTGLMVSSVKLAATLTRPHMHDHRDGCDGC